jgi:hypothetical protein
LKVGNGGGAGFDRIRLPNTNPKKEPTAVKKTYQIVTRAAKQSAAEWLDQTLFWTTADLEAKLIDFQHFYNAHRTHAGLDGRLPESCASASSVPIDLGFYGWQRHCRGLYQTPIAA